MASAIAMNPAIAKKAGPSRMKGIIDHITKLNPMAMPALAKNLWTVG